VTGATSDAVTVAYVHPNEVTTSWHQSLLSLIGWDLGHECRVARGGWLAIRCYGADGIPAARNKAVADFLSNKDADWLFWIDTDMGFEPDAVDRLLEVADPVNRPIVAGLCFAQKHTVPDDMGGWRTALAPTIYDWTTVPETGETGFLSRREYPINTLLQCAGTGSACILIHRSVLEQMAEASDVPGDWYDRIPNPTANGRLLGEDLSFCLRAGALGIPIHVHTGVRTTHFKPAWLGEEDYWASVVPPPATDQAAVIVPVLNRPQNAAPFMASLRASTGLATVYAVANADDVDTVKAWQDAGAEVLFADGISFASKVNAGHAQTTEPWLFITGDDVRFHPGWLDHAQAAAADRIAVVGTNDLGNPRVVRGEHATHMLIRRSYVDQVGASWDGPGTVCHEGYRHWYVDDEIVIAARQRGAFAFAPGATVEHLHPAWGKGADDDVYALGQASQEADRNLFGTRLAAHAS
jgi:glycosyltransferase involved in cell wall biosynthesis